MPIDPSRRLQEQLESLRPALLDLVRSCLIELKSINERLSHPGRQAIIERPTVRLKTVGSTAEKLARKHVPAEDLVSAIHDLAGIRVLCPDLLALNELAAALSAAHTLRVSNTKRWIEVPDGDGYRGIHLIVSSIAPSAIPGLTAEVQLRTILQHGWAHLSHRDVYKPRPVLEPTTMDRLRSTSTLLFETDSELCRLVADIHDDPFAATPRRLSLFLARAGVRISSDDIATIVSLLQSLGLPAYDLGTISTALNSHEEHDVWIRDMWRTVFGTEPPLAELISCKIFVAARGRYWPRRRLLQALVTLRSSSWSEHLGCDDSKALIALLETAGSPNGTAYKYLYTHSHQDEYGSGVSWSFDIDNRYVVKALVDSGAVESTFTEDLETRPTSHGIEGKHRYTIACTVRGHQVAQKVMTACFAHPDNAHQLIASLEAEVFPDGTRWGVTRVVGFSINTVPKDPGPVFVDATWWSRTLSYY